MKIVFNENMKKYNEEHPRCGCACHPSVGALGKNKPSVQVR